MSALQLPDRVVAHGAVATVDPTDAATWYYLSTGPTPQLDPGGRPMATILEAGSVGLVQLSCQLDPPAAELEALRRSIAETAAPGRPVVLRPAVTKVIDIAVSCTVEGEPRATELATSTGSGYPPHVAVFQLSLSGDQLAAARAALAGHRGHIHVRYQLETIHGPSSASADVGSWFDRAEEDGTC